MHSKKEIKITCFHDYDRATVVTRHLCRHILLRFLAKFNVNNGDNKKEIKDKFPLESYFTSCLFDKLYCTMYFSKKYIESRSVKAKKQTFLLIRENPKMS